MGNLLSRLFSSDSRRSSGTQPDASRARKAASIQAAQLLDRVGRSEDRA